MDISEETPFNLFGLGVTGVTGVTLRYPITLERPSRRSEALTLTALMSACRQGRQWQKALEIFRVDVDSVAVDASLLGIAIACDSDMARWQCVLRRCPIKLIKHLSVFLEFVANLQTVRSSCIIGPSFWYIQFSWNLRHYLCSHFNESGVVNIEGTERAEADAGV